ncbi:M1 family metallopeptidase [Nocardia sp. NBC_00416]|uniref:M1 family metallopeptidase n=1 Tax=Nocardia sp. NBC_00416 TaxID=2975991 RepID=UPI002E22A29D
MRLTRWLIAGVVVLSSPTLTPAAAQAPSGPLAGAQGLGDPYFPLDGNGGYDVEHYDVTLGYDPAGHQLTGSTRIDANATQPLTSFDLDYTGPQVRAVRVNDLPADFEWRKPHELVVHPPLPLLPGLPFTVTVDYAGTAADTRGEGWTYSPTGGAFAAGEPHSASTWYPLNDSPRDKATFTLHATVPAEWEVMSGGVRTRDEVRGGFRTVSWEQRQPVIGYLTTVAIDRFDYLEQRRANGTPLLSAFAPGVGNLREHEERLPEILDFAESLYGPYPFDAAGGIYLAAEIPFSLETQTRPTYAAWADLNTVVHEVAHQWWGDSVSVHSWSDICLNECIASYTADFLWPERKEGVDIDARYRDRIRKALAKPSFWEVPLEDPGADKLFTSVYYKGPLFMHALRKQLGDTVFFGALREFMTAHAYGHASMPEFRAFIQSKSSTDLTGFLDAWLRGTTPPPEQYLYPGSLRG